MRVAVGSTNPVKIRAVSNAFKKAFGSKIEVIPTNVSSEVSNQPTTDTETYKGALSRAKRALTKSKSHFGVGIEGGIQKHNHGVFSNAWVVVANRKGRLGSGTSARFALPGKVLKLMGSGDELGVAVDKLVGGKGTNRRGGAYAALTAGKLSRSKAYEQGILCALMPFLTPNHWR